MNNTMKKALIFLLIILALGVIGYYGFRDTESEDDTIVVESTPQNVMIEPVPEVPLVASPTPPMAKQSPQSNGSYHVTIQTNHGVIVFETYDSDAPLAVENFMKLAEQGFYNGTIFHRVINGFMIQGGDPEGTGRGGPGYTFADELDPISESYKAGYQKGVVAMANRGPDTNGSQFFIMLENYPLPNNYTIFGKVISGQEVVDTIGKLPVGPGDKPAADVVMETVTVEEKQ
jgi:cyclophilin family peptidyl-prolyl cis-trans isomerase